MSFKHLSDLLKVFYFTSSLRKCCCWFVVLITVLFLTTEKSLGENHPSAPFTISLDVSDNNGFGVSCNSDADGAIDLTIAGGTLPFQFEWSNGSTDEDIFGLTSGTYIVTVIDADNDTVIDSAFVSEPDPIDLNLFTVDANAAPDGEASVSPVGGAGGYAYDWSTGATTSSITGLLPGNYTITVTDINSCTATDIAMIQNALGACIIVTDSVRQVSCFGFNNGAIYISEFAAIPPITYQWSNGATSQDITGLAPGTYTVTITDVIACTATETFVITEPSALTLSLTPTSATCNLSNGSIASLTGGGTTNYSYNWSNGQTTPSATGLAPATYTLTVTDANGCTISQTSSVGALPPPQVVIDSVKAVSCFGGNNGAVYSTITGGANPISILWSNSATTDDITGLLAGSYTVTVTDNDGCTATATGNVIQPAAALNDSVQVTNASCGNSNGSVTVFPYNGTPTYSYLWNTGATSQTISSLAPGIYTVTITDFNSCTRQRSVSIVNQPGPLAVIDSVIHVKCFGQATGGIYISVSGGTNPISYLWTGGSTAQDLINRPVGTYTVTVTDGNLCTFSLNATINQPAAALNDSVQVTNASCGNSNGNITVFPYNGTSPYTYLWNTGATAQSINSLSPGSYTVTITDFNSCTRQRSVSIVNQPGPVAILDSIRNVRCFGQSNGGIFISVSGGTNPISYLWTGGSTAQDLINRPAGTYTVTVTDGNACTFSLSATINQPAAALNDSVQVTNPSCGNNNGSVTVFPYNGTSPYTYLWNTGATSQTVSNLAPGSYTVTITDFNSCTRLRNVSLVNQPGPVAVLDSIRHVKCFGQATGGIFISVIGGTSPISYQWTGGSTSQDLTNVLSGTYIVTVSDANNCSVSFGATINQPATALNDSAQATKTTCGLNNGAITVFPYNGTGPYTFLWSNAQTSQTITGLAPGNYTVTVTDNNSCTKQRVVNVGITSFPVAVLDSVRHVRCFGASTGGVFISVPGAVLPVSYQWSNGATSSDIINVPAGTYTMTVTDANMCTSSVSGTVNQPAAALNDSVQITNVSCSGNNGSVTVFPFGGTPSYTFLWSNSATSATISGLSPGTYTVTVTDANSCTKLRVVNVTTIGNPVAVIDSSKKVSCFGGNDGALFVSVSGGTAPYSFLWSNSASSQNLLNVATGTYTVTVTDINSCTAQVSGLVSQPSAALNDSVQFTNATCGNNNGSATIFPYGGTAPYTFLWSTSQTTQTISSLGTGLYTVTVTDSAGCTRQRVVSISNISGPAVSVNTIGNVNCFGASTGSVSINVSGGTAPFSYLWSNAATSQNISNVPSGNYTVTVTDANSCTASVSAFVPQTATPVNDSIQVNHTSCGAPNGNATVFPFGGTSPYTVLWSTSSTSPTIFNLSAGTYTVTITDNLGCTKQDVAVINASSGPVVSINSIVNANCFGESNGGINISVSGGTPPYTYLWSNNSTAQNLSNVPAGLYTLTVTDLANCTAVISGTVGQPSVLTAQLFVTDAACGIANGEISAQPSGGTSPYNYLWNNSQTSQTITNLFAGIYTVTITDNQGCSITLSDTIINFNGPMIVPNSVTHVLCNGDNTGAINISITGGTAPLTFLWSNNQTTQNISALLAGPYTVTVTDSNSCSAQSNFVVSQPPAITDSAVVVPATCGLDNGSITAMPYGGIQPYSYLWNTSATTQTIANLAGGNYTLTISDSAGCSIVRSYNVQSFSQVIIALDSVVAVKCNGNSTGAVYVTVSGGSGPYGYSWSNSVSSEDNIGIVAGVYTLVVTDSYQCVDSMTFNVTQPPPLLDSLNTNPATCNLNNGSAKIYPYGGTPGYSYLWNPGGTTSQTAMNLAPGSYTVTVTDLNGCTSVRNLNISSIPIHTVTLNTLINVDCNGQSTGSISINVGGGVTPYSYLWSNTATTQNIQNLASGTYTVTVTDSVNCPVSQSFTVQQSSAISDNGVVTNATCGLPNGIVAVTPSGGNSPYQYLWSNNETTNSISGLLPGSYTVTITDSLGCTFSNSFNVVDIPGPDILLDNITDATCFGGADGSVSLTILNGTQPISILWSNNETTEDISNLLAGSYTVTVTDANNCVQTEIYTVGEGTLITDGAVVVDAVCGDANGSITLNPSGGTGPYTFLWSNGVTLSSISGLSSGSYSVTITDSVACPVNYQFTVNNQGSPVIAVDSIVQIKCAGDSTGAIYINVTGGVQPYSYVWSNLSVQPNLTGLPAGIYSVVVTDANNCTATMTDTISEPQPITVIFDIIPANCNSANGSIEAIVSGGTGTYSLVWSTFETTPLIENLSAGSYTLTVTDQNQCQKTFIASVSNLSAPVIAVIDSVNVSCFGLTNGSITVSVTGGQTPYNYSWTNTSQSGNQITNLAGNTTYTLTITDSLGCVAIRSVFISQPAAISINAIIPQLNDTFNLTCAGSTDGSIKIQVSGGTSPYSYIWSNLALTDSIGSLAAGTYTVTVTDSRMCTASRTMIVTQPPLLVSNAGSNNVICGTNSDTLNASIPVFGTGYWTVISGTGVFADSTSINTEVSNLSNGVNVFQWIVTDGVCSAVSQVVITFNTQIFAIAGINREVCDNSILLTATAPQFGFGYWQVVNSTGVFADSSKAVTNVSGLQPGINRFQWIVVNGTCRDTADLVIFLKDPFLCIEEVEMPTGFTPNNDGKNDYFVIKGIEEYPDNSIVIFNRWGNIVYEKSGYNNEWDGVNNDGKPLPEGTYFVVFKIRSINRILNSYIDLRR